MSESKHTPLPWDVQNKGNLHGVNARHEVVEGVNNGEKNLPTIARMPDLSERSYANAAFIVRCCNCHDELVGALKSVIQDMNIPGPPVNLSMDTCLKIDAAIAKATD